VALHSKPSPAPRCLVVEDEPLIARALVRQLEQLGIRVTVAASLSAMPGLEGNFDCAIIDLDLPDGCGLDVESHLPAGALLSGPVFFSATERLDLQFQAAERSVFVRKDQGAAAAIKALSTQLARSCTHGKSGTFVRPTGPPSDLYSANRARTQSRS
jgi:CheY-like chemotaxis protein